MVQDTPMSRRVVDRQMSIDHHRPLMNVEVAGGRVRKYTPPPGWSVAACRFAPDPTPRQERAPLSHCGSARFAYNTGLANAAAAFGDNKGG
jgi:hypothetical protein